MRGRDGLKSITMFWWINHSTLQTQAESEKHQPDVKYKEVWSTPEQQPSGNTV